MFIWQSGSFPYVQGLMPFDLGQTQGRCGLGGGWLTLIEGLAEGRLALEQVVFNPGETRSV